MGKSTNTFHYESFAKRISKVGGDSVKWSAKLAKASEKTESFLLDAIAKWNDMDHGQDYLDFIFDLPSPREMQTVAQVLFHKDVIMGAILKHLTREESRSRISIVEITMGAIRDFRESFDDHLVPVLQSLLQVAGENADSPHRPIAGKGADSTVEVQLIETVFLAVTLLCRLHSEPLNKQHRKTFGLFLPLVGSLRGYVRRFSAEAYSVLLRKTTKLDRITQLAVAHASHERLVDGVATALFSTLRGTNKLLHSRAQQKLKQLLCGAFASAEWRESAKAVLMRTVELLAGFAAGPEMAKAVLTITEFAVNAPSEDAIVCWGLIVHAVEHSRALKENATDIATPLLDAMKAALEKDKEHTDEYLELVPTLSLRVWSLPSLPSTVSSSLLALLSSIANWLTGDQSVRLLGKLRDLPNFDLQVMPILGRIAAKECGSEDGLSESTIQLYAELCQTRRPLSDAWKTRDGRLPFFNTADHIATKKAVSSRLSSLDSQSDEVQAMLLVVWPWLYSTHETPTGLSTVVDWLRRKLTEKGETEEKSDGERLSQLVLIATTALYTMDAQALMKIEKDEVMAFVRRCGSTDSAVRVLWLWLHARDEWSDEGEAVELCELMGEALLNGRGSVRRAILECLAAFELELPTSEEGHRESESAFQVLLSAEREVLDLEGYRQRLLCLRKLSHPYHRRYLPEGMTTMTEHVIIRAVLSQLMERFTIMWPQIHEIAATFAVGMEIDDFWRTMKAAFDMAERGIREEKSVVEQPWFADIVTGANEMKPDFISFRGQLFKFLATVPQVAERRTRLLSPILLDIFQYDYLQEEAATVEEGDEEGMEDEDKEEEEGEEVEGKEKKRKGKRGLRLGKKAAVQSLSAGLELFAKFSDLKSVYKEKQIRAMLDELLLCAEVHRPVLACLFAYKNKALLQYKDNLERLIGEKTFRDELTLFAVDYQDCVVQEAHRDHVIPVFLRIVLGLLKSRLPAHAMRKTALLQAIAGCRSNELSTFISILFAPIMPQLGNAEEDPLLKKVEEDLREHVKNISLQRTGWAIRMVSSILSRLSSSLSPSDQSLLLRLLFVACILIQQAKAHFPLKALKNLRQAIGEALQQFFKSFPHRPLSPTELSVLSTHFLSVDATPAPIPEGVRDATLPSTATATSLSVLRLIASWTALPQLYSLLNARCLHLEGEVEEGKGKKAAKEKKTPFHLLCSTLVLSLKKRETVLVARTAFSNLLTLADEKQTNADLDEEELPRLEGTVNTGTRLVVQQLPYMLAFLLNTIEQGQHSNASVDLELLSRIAPYIDSRSHRARFAGILLKQAVDKPRDIRLPTILTALANFAPALDKPRRVLRSMIPLFSAVDPRPSREALSAVLRALAKNERLTDKGLRRLLTAAADLDAWDGTRVDEADYEKRHAAYGVLMESCRSSSALDADLAALLVHDHVHALRTVTDVALRSAASEGLQAVVKSVAERGVREEELEEEEGGEKKGEEREGQGKDERRRIVDRHVIPLIVRGFGHKDQSVRDEFIRTFAVLVRSCAWHDQLAPIVNLQSEDEEVDFFENIVHIQSHRRQRALWKLAEAIEGEKTGIPVEVLLKFLVPLVQPWFVLTAEISNSALSDEALRVLTAVLSKAEWKKYIGMADYWMRKLKAAEEQRKAVVRVVVAVVDAFHFDISDESSSIRRRVLGHLLPALKECVDSKEAQSVHKRAGAKKYYSEEDDVQRAPVALATAKLLLKLPQAVMDQHLHGLVLKMCSLLGSRSDRVRIVARKTLCSMCEALGPKYTSFVLKEMKTTLTRGYQVHVMIYTVHTLLTQLQSVLGYGDIDSAVDEVVEACCEDLFGRIAEEKTVGAIREATMEAKQSKSLDTLLLVARFISCSSIGRFIRPLETALDEKPDAKTHKIVGGALREIAVGLKRNQGMDHRQLLIYVHHVINSNLAKLVEKEVGALQIEEEHEERTAKPESCLILPKAPKRIGAMEKTKKGHAPVLLEFGLQLLSAVLSSIAAQDKKQEGDEARIDPFLGIVLQTLGLKYEKVVTIALRCIQLLLPRDLPSLQKTVKPLSDRLFALLSTYTGFATGKGGAMTLNQLMFKTIASLIKYAKDDVLGGDRVEILLSYIHGDLLETHKQATAFALLKALVQRGIEHPELRKIMKRVEEMSVQSEIDYVRAHCRQLLLLFIGNHPHGKKVELHLNFLLAQLDYETEDGRLSAIETLHALFGSLVQKALDPVGLNCVIRFASRLVSEPNEKGRAMAAMATRRLLGNLSESRRNDAFLATSDWLREEKDGIRAAGASMMLQFCLMEGGAVKEEADKKRLEEAGDMLADSLDVDLSSFSTRTVVLLLDALSAVSVVLRENGSRLRNTDKAYQMAEKWSKSGVSELRRPAAALLGNLLAFGEADLSLPAWRLFEAAVWPLSAKGTVDGEVARQCMKNCLATMDRLGDEEMEAACQRLEKLARHEIVNAPNESIKRSSVFKIAAAAALKSSEGPRLTAILDHTIPLLLRELNRKSTPAVADELCPLASEVMEVMKKRAGEKEVAVRMASGMKENRERVERNKANRKRLAAIDPEAAAAETMAKQKRKRETRKRRLDKMNPMRVVKRRREKERREGEE